MTFSPNNDAPKRRRSKLFVALVAVLAVVCVVGVLAFAYVNDYYHDADVQHRNLVSTEALPVEQGDNYLAFGNPDAATGLVFYPGAKVEYSAYAPFMRALAERGYFAVVVQMPFNFAFFDVNAADRVRETFPNVDSWWVGGHSLGGSMAAQYAADHADDPQLAGIVLAAAYSASDLSNTNLGALVVYGSNDQVLNRDKLSTSEPLLPPDAQTVVIEGGNHASFGNYGPQAGDGTATITPQDQQTRAADAIDEYVEAHN